MAFWGEMGKFFIGGGYSMWIVMAFSAALLVLGGRFVLRPRASSLAILKALSWATVFAVFSGVAANLAAVGRNVPNMDLGEKNPAMVIIYGISESMAPAILGFSLLAIAWMFIAVGLHRSATAAATDDD